ncbi:MAG: type 2 isopentenyl-diphosphate Delta-isomerase [Thermoplasmata archaeon]|nr:type 2 isopentenyl-diphosphate Delta-isomerase [Thermoplasmata archaeon]
MTENGREIEERKGDHINLYVEKHPTSRWNYWDDIVLVHESVPGFDLDEVNLTCELFGKRLNAPIIISGMTGGYPRAKEINRRLAEAAERVGVGMGVGSQRAALANPETVDTYSVVKDYRVPLMLANLGAPQFSDGTYTLEDVERCMDMVGAHLTAVHLNYLQEVVQPEGDTFSKDFWDNIRPVAGKHPLIIKETGAGISRNTALKAREIGFKGIDVGGLGGTSFSAMEYPRAERTGDELKTSLGS